ncbi:hypothetical protein ACFE04_024300 [Oxalis oulophora]
MDVHDDPTYAYDEHSDYELSEGLGDDDGLIDIDIEGNMPTNQFERKGEDEGYITVSELVGREEDDFNNYEENQYSYDELQDVQQSDDDNDDNGCEGKARNCY